MIYMSIILLILQFLFFDLPKTAVLRGHFQHVDHVDTVRLRTGYQSLKTVISPTGNFEFTIYGLSEPTAAELNFSGQQTKLYISPGDDIQMNLDFLDFDKTLIYKGKGEGVNINNYLAQSLYKFEFGPERSIDNPFPILPNTSPQQMRFKADKFRINQLLFLAQYGEKFPIPKTFEKQIETSINLKWGTQLFSYLAFVRDTEQLDEKALSELYNSNYFDFTKQLPFKNLDYYIQPTKLPELVAQFLDAYQFRLLPTGKFDGDTADAQRIIALANIELGNTKARGHALRMLVETQISYNLSGVLPLYFEYRLQNTDSTTARYLRELIIQQQSLQPGKPAPDFSLVDYSGTKLSLHDFIGQVVYIDFWGTWCKPCMAQMKDSRKLVATFQKQPVVFVYIAVNDEENKWRETIIRDSLKEYNSKHFLLKNENYIVNTYRISSFPAYYLIDKKGNIIDSNAPRPSETEKINSAIKCALKDN